MSEDGMKQFKINKDWRMRLEASHNLKKEQGLIMKSILDDLDDVNRKQAEARIIRGPSKTMMNRVRNHIDEEIMRNQKMNLLDPEQTKKHLLGMVDSDWAKQIDTKNEQFDPTAKFVKAELPTVTVKRGGMQWGAKKKDTSDPVKHPAHYTSGKIEVWDFIVDKKLDYCPGCAVKYIARAGRKDKNTHIQDLEKALAYLKRFFKQLQDSPEPRYAEGKIDPLDFIQDQGLSYCLGSAVEHICQFGGEIDYKENILVAIRFVEQEINYVKEKQNV